MTSSTMTSRSMTSSTMTARAFATVHGSSHNWDSLQFRFIFALSFAFHLVTAIAARFTPRFWRDAVPHRSILAEAVEAAGTTARIAFYG